MISKELPLQLLKVDMVNRDGNSVWLPAREPARRQNNCIQVGLPWWMFLFFWSFVCFQADQSTACEIFWPQMRIQDAQRSRVDINKKIVVTFLNWGATTEVERGQVYSYQPPRDIKMSSLRS